MKEVKIMKMKKITALLAAFMIMATAAGCGDSSNSESGTTTEVSQSDNSDSTEAAAETDASEENTETEASETDRAEVPAEVDEQLKELSANEVITLMGNGINLGNTMEAYGHQKYVEGADPTSFETSWGQPQTTQEMIDGMKAAGFDTLRIPVAWTNGMNFESGDYTIDARLLDRVDQIINWALDADMYVIVNDHWDGSWWGMFGSADEATREKAMEMYKAMWTQLSEHYADYSYRLIFESANEELGDRLNDTDIAADSGTLSKKECYETTNKINSEFVKLVRSTGGNNEDRFLLIAGYNTDIANTVRDDYVMPEDTADSKLMVSVHYYTPWDYCGTDAVNQWGSPSDYEEQNKLLGSMSKFTEQGYGVVIGEYAVMSSKSAQKPDSDLFYTNFLNNCDYYNYCPVLWDCNDLYKRLQGKITDELYAQLYLDRSYEKQSAEYTEDQIKENAKAGMDEALSAANDRLMEGISLPASDDMAIAWIMFNSADYTAAYSVGDTYDPTNMTTGIVADNVQITGEGTYTVSLDFTALGGTKGTAFSALGISNGETFFPGYIYTIDSIKINGEDIEMTANGYTTSDDDVCTRVNLFNQWVTNIPEDARSTDSEDLSASIVDISDKTLINTLSVTFTVTAP